MAVGSELTVKVERMAYGADAIAHTPEGKTVFVSGAVAGDVVRASIASESDTFARAQMVELLEGSPDRVKPTCPYATICGGCPWAALSYDAQRFTTFNPEAYVRYRFQFSDRVGEFPVPDIKFFTKIPAE